MPLFFLRVGRTLVRYKGIRCDCVRVVYISRWCRSVPRVRVIFSHGGEGREAFAGPLVGFQYISFRFVFSSRPSSCFASRGGVSLLRLVVGFSSCVSSCCLVSSFRPCVLAMSFVGRFMSVAFRRGRFVSFLCFVSRFVLCAVFIRPVLFLSPSVACEAGRVRRGVDVLVVMRSGRRCSVLVFLIGSAGRGTGRVWCVPFYSAYSCLYSRWLVYGMDSVGGDNDGKNVIAIRRLMRARCNTRRINEMNG